MSNSNNKLRPILLIGIPASGKSWVMNKVKDLYQVVEHDDYIGIGEDYLKTVTDMVKYASKRVLFNTPFSVSAYSRLNPLHVYIIEPEEVVFARYVARNNKPPAKGDATRQATYLKRAKESGSFYGTSSEVLAHLKVIA